MPKFQHGSYPGSAKSKASTAQGTPSGDTFSNFVYELASEAFANAAGGGKKEALSYLRSAMLRGATALGKEAIRGAMDYVSAWYDQGRKTPPSSEVSPTRTTKKEGIPAPPQTRSGKATRVTTQRKAPPGRKPPKASDPLLAQGWIVEVMPPQGDRHSPWSDTPFTDFIQIECSYLAARHIASMQKNGLNPSILEQYCRWAMEQRKLDVGISCTNFMVQFNKNWHIPMGLWGLLQYCGEYVEGGKRFSFSAVDTVVPASVTNAYPNLFMSDTLQNDEVVLTGSAVACTFDAVRDYGQRCSEFFSLFASRQYSALPKKAPDASAHAYFLVNSSGTQMPDMMCCASNNYDPEVAILLCPISRGAQEGANVRTIRRVTAVTASNAALHSLIRRGYTWCCHNAVIRLPRLKGIFDGTELKTFQHVELTASGLWSSYVELCKQSIVAIDQVTSWSNNELASYQICCEAAFVYRTKMSAADLNHSNPYVSEAVKVTKFPLPVKAFLDGIGPYVHDGILYLCQDGSTSIGNWWLHCSDGTTWLESAAAATIAYNAVAITNTTHQNTPKTPYRLYDVVSMDWNRLVNDASKHILVDVIDWVSKGDHSIPSIGLYTSPIGDRKHTLQGGTHVVNIERLMPRRICFPTKPTLVDLVKSMMGICRMKAFSADYASMPEYPFEYEGLDESGVMNVVESLLDASIGERNQLSLEMEKALENPLVSQLPAGRLVRGLTDDHISMDFHHSYVGTLNSLNVRPWVKRVPLPKKK